MMLAGIEGLIIREKALTIHTHRVIFKLYTDTHTDIHSHMKDRQGLTHLVCLSLNRLPNIPPYMPQCLRKTIEKL